MMPLKTSDLIWCPRTGPLRQKYQGFSPPSCGGVPGVPQGEDTL